MNDPILIDLVIAEPILLELELAPEYYVGTAQAGPQGEQGEQGEQGDPWTFTEGSKASYVDAGTLPDVSITDDYIYFCVQTGTAETTAGAKDGTAIWKKAVLFQT